MNNEAILIDSNAKEKILTSAEKKHLETFGIEPNYIGINWRRPREEIDKEILEHIKKGIPYDEYEFLNDEEKEAFNKGLLRF